MTNRLNRVGFRNVNAVIQSPFVRKNIVDEKLWNSFWNLFFRMASVVNKELLKTIGKMYKGMPKENWSAYHRMQFLFE